MVPQKDVENFVDYEKTESSSYADLWKGRDSRVDDGGEKEAVGLFGACAQRERFGGGQRGARRRQRKNYMDGLKEQIRCKKMSEALRLAEHRSTLRSNVAKVYIETAHR